MKPLTIILASTLGLHANPALVDPATPKLEGYTPTFSDEFNGKQLDKKKWHLGINAGNAILSNKHSAYTADNISFKDGQLLLRGKKPAQPVQSRVYGGKTALFNYSSAAINTQNLFHLTGEFYIEIRCTFPTNPGGFCAFWTMPGSRENLHTNERHETDFFEFKCNPAKASHYQYFSSLWWHEVTTKETQGLPTEAISKRGDNAFWLKQQKHKPHYQPRNGKVTKGINFAQPITMGFKASKDQLSWHIVQNGSAYNATPYMTFKKQKVHSRPKSSTDKTPFLKVFRPVPKFDNYIILNYRLSQANWTGGPVDESALPATMKVDYIRVYQKKNDTPTP